MFSRLIFLFILIGKLAFSQNGCTDIQAINYNSLATINDGSCIYPATTLSLNLLTGLATPLLDESSGVTFFDGNLWTHIDNTSSAIYKIDSLSASILQQVSVGFATNSDWEDLTTSTDHIFIGDFGNNYGNRTNLHILKIAKSAITPVLMSVNAEVINFTYPDQMIFTPQLNNNSFDCEAFFFYNDSLHLFTKDWVSKITKHYILPADAGTYTASLVDSFNVNGLITSASIQNNGVVALLGYDNTGIAPCFVWMLYDYPGNNFFGGNKRKFSIGSAISIGQVEGIELVGNNYGFITNERFQKFNFNVPPQLKSFDLSNYLPSAATATLTPTKKQIIYNIFPVPSDDVIKVSILPFPRNTIYDFVVNDLNGKTVMKEKIEESISSYSIHNLPSGIYKGKIYLNNKLMSMIQIVKN